MELLAGEEKYDTEVVRDQGTNIKHLFDLIIHKTETKKKSSEAARMHLQDELQRSLLELSAANRAHENRGEIQEI